MTENLLYAGLALIFLLVAGGAIALSRFWTARFSADSRALSSRLKEIALRRREDAQSQLQKSSMGLQTAWLQWILAHAPGVQRLGLLLTRSGSTRTVAEVMALSAGLGLLAWLLLTFLLNAPWVMTVPFGIDAFSLPWAYLMQQEKNRRLRFEEQLPEALDFMTRALRAGHGLSVAIGMVGDELPDPVGPEFKTVFEHIKLGMAFGDAMGQMAERINSSDLNFLVIALMIQRKTGGNLTELLTTLSKTVRERIKLKGKIRVLASEGKLSGIMIGSLPFALGGILSVLNPIYMSTLWTTTTGQMLMLVNLGMIFIGAVWMWKIVQIKV
jgi:tight adherence protein B